MEVKVPMTCGRCGRSDEKTVSIETAQALVNEITSKSEVLTNLKAYGEQLDKNLSPAVILYLRTSDGYILKTLDNLCQKPDAKRNKGCNARVNELLKDIFEMGRGEPKERKPRKVKEKADAAPAPATAPAGTPKQKGK